MTSPDLPPWTWLANLWCGWTHGGGDIKRDSLDRINWQCRKCGRWSDPVSAEDEAKMTDAAIRRAAEGKP